MRLFVALDLPRVLRTRLAFLAGGLPGVRWVPPENYHLTLRFIGELPRWRAEEVDEALAGVRAPGFSLVLGGVGTLEKAGRVASLWVGAMRNPALEHLQAKVEAALQRAGVERERRRFQPHVTLARLGGARLAGARLAGARLGGARLEGTRLEGTRLGGARSEGVAADKVAGWVQSHNLFRSEPVAVERFTLFSSLLGKEQAAYEPEVEYALAAARDMGAGVDQRAGLG